MTKINESFKAIRVNRHILIILLLVFNSMSVRADTIYFTDGMKTVCQEKAWEDNGEIKCEYQGVVLNYKKSDVLRIEIRRTENEVAEQPSEKKPEGGPGPVKQTDRPQTALKAEAVPASGNPAFYDPRRKQKYWTSKTSGHDTLQGALTALAQQYNRSPQWIQAHMGETNDLGEIHKNLANSISQDKGKIAETKSANTGSIEFYNPRRVHKYWTGKASKHDSLNEALEALAQEYDRSVQWVQTYIGETNDLDEIHQNLKSRKHVEAAQ